jgi:hypothetical protein
MRGTFNVWSWGKYGPILQQPQFGVGMNVWSYAIGFHIKMNITILVMG